MKDIKNLKHFLAQLWANCLGPSNDDLLINGNSVIFPNKIHPIKLNTCYEILYIMKDKISMNTHQLLRFWKNSFYFSNILLEISNFQHNINIECDEIFKNLKTSGHQDIRPQQFPQGYTCFKQVRTPIGQ